MNEIGTNGATRRALGRGLADILGDDAPKSESVNTAEATYRIAAILEGVEDRQVANIFRFVRDIRQTAKGETVQEIGEGLNRIAAERRAAEREPKKGWWRKK